MGAERKLVTMLVADVDEAAPGFEGLDPEDAGTALAAHLDLVQAEVWRFGGLVEQTLAGRTVAVFGVPRTREDDPERAVLAALAIRDALAGRAASVQVTVATGEALVGQAGAVGSARLAGGRRVAGEPLATCTRLQELAQPGAVLVSEATGQATGGTISYGPVLTGPEGRTAGALHALAPRIHLQAGWGVGPLPPMVARQPELRALAEQLELAVEERAPRLVTVLGPPGIGKSRLVAELAGAGAGTVPVQWLRAAGPPSAEPLTVSALSDVVRAQAGVVDADPPAQAGAKLARAAAAVLAEPSATWVAGHLRRLLGIPGGPPADGQGAPGGTGASGSPGGTGESGEARAAWRQWLHAVAAGRPLALVVEDLHRADTALLEFLDDLVDPETAGPVPLLVVTTARPELLQRRPRWATDHTALTLGALSDGDTTRLLEDLLAGHGVPAEVGPRLLARIGGNPLFAQEWVRMLRDRGLPLDEPDDPTGPTLLPTTVHAIIAARLDALPPDEKAVLRDAAVLGPVGWVGALAAVGGQDQAELDACLHRLEGKEFVRLAPRSRLPGETEFAFGHVLVRDVAYGQVLRAERATKHRLAAAWLQALGVEAGLVADHWRAAVTFARAAGQDLAGLAGGRDVLRAAGDRAAGLGAHSAATRYYASAVELCPPADPERPELLLRLGRARCQGEGGGQDVLVEARDALLAGGDAVTAAEAEMLLAELAFLHGRGGERVEHLERALTMVATAPPSGPKAAVLRGCMLHYAVASRPAEARAVAAQVLAMAEGLGLRDLEADALGTIGLARVDAGDAAGVADLERALAIGQELGSAGTILWHLNLTWAAAALGDLAAAAAALDDAERAAARFGSARRLRSVRLQRVAALYWAGLWDEAVAVVDALEARVGGDGHYLEWECRTWRGRIRLARGSLDGAAEDAARALDLAREAADPQARNPTLAFRARVLLAAGRRDEAAALAAELLEGLGGSLLGPEVGADLGLVLAGLGVPVAEVDKRGVPPSAWLAAARALAGGDPVAAAGMYDRIGSRPDAALARLAAAGHLLAAGRGAEADAQLRAATAFWREVGAERHLGEAARLSAGPG